MSKKGVTLIELIVAMGIFIVIVTIAVGAFVTISRMKSLTSTMKDTQQKTRIALEMITRLSRQAEKVVVSSDKKNIELYFDLDTPTPEGVKFSIEQDTLNYYGCNTMDGPKCSESGWATATDLFGDKIIIDTQNSQFLKIGTVPPLLEVHLYSQTVEQDNQYFSDKINIDTSIILESIK